MKEINEQEITQYLLGALSPENHRAFEEAMRQDPKLAEAVDLHRVTDDLEWVLREDRMLEQVRQWELDEKQQSKKRWSIVLIGILLTAIAGTGIYFYAYSIRQASGVEQTHPGPQAEFPLAVDTGSSRQTTPNFPANPKKNAGRNPATAWAKQAGNMFPRQKDLRNVFIDQMGKSVKDEFQTGVDAITRGDYATASEYFRQMETAGRFSDNSRGYMLYGYACFFNQNYAGAEKCFRHVLGTTPMFNTEAEWMLCLSKYAQHGPVGNVLLQQIAGDPQHPHYSEVQELLQNTVK